MPNLDGASQDTTCEFCVELSRPRASRFWRNYHHVLPSRLAVESEDFVALPTMGQIFRGSVLILPRQHHEAFALIPETKRESLYPLLDIVAQVTSNLGHLVLFEHGARAHTEGGCGIYHAHLHIVPVPAPVLWPEILQIPASTAPSLESALRKVSQCDEYLLFHDTSGETAYITPQPPLTFGSQYFRRALARHFAITRSWNWRDYPSEELWLMETYQLFSHVSIP